MMNTSRGVGNGQYPSLAELLGNAESAIKEGDLLFTVSDGASYAAVTATGDNPIQNTSPQLYAELKQKSASSSNIEWDFEADFNDGVELRSGYGTRNAFGNKALDFSRASASGNINKSGVMETIGIDEPRIGSFGLSIYGEYTNLIKYSEDFSQSVWSNSSGAVTVSQDGTLSSDGVSQAWKVTNTNATDVKPLQQLFTASQDSKLSYEIDVKYADSDKIALAYTSDNELFAFTSFTFSTKSISEETRAQASVEELSGGWFRITLLPDNTTGLGLVSVRVYPVGTTASPQVGSVYASKVSVVYGSTPLPYIKTEATPVTSSPDVATIPMMNNMPAEGNPFTIEVDCSIPISSTEAVSVIRNGITQLSGFYLDRPSALQSDIRFGLSDGDGTPRNIIFPFPSESETRFTLLFDGSKSYVFADGTLIASTTCIGSTYDLSGVIDIGRRLNGLSFLNSSIKSLRIIHRELTVEEISSRGGYNE